MSPIQPTLTDVDVIDFCARGYIMMEGIIADDVNRNVFDYLEEHPTTEPNSILDEKFFVQEVLLHPKVAGAARSLLGENFRLPHIMSNHRSVGAKHVTGGWHWDGGSIAYPPSVNYLQIFYYPQDVPVEMGPTALIPGSHLIHQDAAYMAHFGNFRHQVLTTAPAGSVFVTAYPIWHRPTTKTSGATRNLLKWNCWRTVPPQRDWIIDPDFDRRTANFKGNDPPMGRYIFNSPLAVTREPAWVVGEMYDWLCGDVKSFGVIGGQGWPLETEKGQPARTRELVDDANRLLEQLKEYKPAGR